MNYKTAKKLKDNGFSQDGTKYIGGHFITNEDTGGERVYVPSLSELIDVCGDGFTALNRQYSDKTFSASGRSGWVVGDTASETLANLWLALIKKDA